MTVFYNNVKRKSLLITRSPQDNDALKILIEKKGMKAISFPLYTYEACDLKDEIKKRLYTLENYDWLVLTSVRSVRFFLKLLADLKIDFSCLSKLKIAAVGEKTAAELRKEKLKVDLQPEQSSSKKMALQGAFQKTKKLKILFPHAEDARQEFVDLLKESHQILNFVLYRKQPLPHAREECQKILREKINWILFYSPSAVDQFMNLFDANDLNRFFRKTRIAAIGQTTCDHLKKKNLCCDLMSEKSTSEDLLERIILQK